MDSNGLGNKNYKAASSIYDFQVIDIDRNLFFLSNYSNHVCIIVNVASNCDTTHANYTQLLDLYEKYGNSKGLKILAFPCNQFMSSEPGTNEDIKRFVTSEYFHGNRRLELFNKVEVNGDDAHPLWKYLQEKQGGFMGDSIKWNFSKFIINKRGQPVARYSPLTEPKDIEKDLLEYLNE